MLLSFLEEIENKRNEADVIPDDFLSEDKYNEIKRYEFPKLKIS